MLARCNNGLARHKSIHWLHRAISTTSCKSTGSSAENKQSESTEVQPFRPLTEDEIQKITNLDNIHIVTKFQQKQPQRPPLVQNFFIGKVDRELLTYPQMLAVKDFNAMAEKLTTNTNYFVNNALTPMELRFRDLSNAMVDDFRSLNLFAASVHERFAGAGLFKSEMNFTTESEANDIKSFSILAGHRLAIEAISDHGDTSHHNEYLMDMAKGDRIGAICLHDPLAKEWNTIKVTKSETGDYVLNGTKKFAIISQHANLLVVVAEKSHELKQEDRDDTDDEDELELYDDYMAFVLDSKAPGITYTDAGNTFLGNEIPLTTVNFSNVHVEKEKLLSESIDYRKTSDKLIVSSRLQAATLNMIQAKNTLNHLIQYSVNTKINSENLRDLVFVRENIARTACNLYGLESMIYLTAGIIDQYDTPKVNVESALTKAYSQDILRDLTAFATKLMGPSVTIAGHPAGLEITKILQLQSNETSSDLKSHVGLVGLKHAAAYFGSRTNDYKDSSLLKLGLGNPTIEYIKPKQLLGDFLHHIFIEPANEIECSIVRLQCSSEMLLNRHGDSVQQRHSEIQQLGHAAMLNYAMFASVGRASRSYCIGLRHSVYETVLAGSLILAASPEILKVALDIKHDRSDSNSEQKSIYNFTAKQFKTQSFSVPPVKKTL